MNILTFDIEDWFHILDHPQTSDFNNWENFESRIEYGLNEIMDILFQSDVKATFFVLGWIAEKYPKLISQLADLNFEIGTHSHFHQLCYQQDRNTFQNDISVKS